MAKKPELILTFSYGFPYKNVLPIYNDISSIKHINAYCIEIERDDGTVYEVNSRDTKEIDTAYAIAKAVIAGRNYGA
jgi:hypothetical protein